jgi:hypothetical protein
MKARITIEYELPWHERLTRTELRDREEEAWITGAIAIPDLTAAIVKFELLDGQWGEGKSCSVSPPLLGECETATGCRAGRWDCIIRPSSAASSAPWSKARWLRSTIDPVPVESHRSRSKPRRGWCRCTPEGEGPRLRMHGRSGSFASSRHHRKHVRTTQESGWIAAVPRTGGLQANYGSRDVAKSQSCPVAMLHLSKHEGVVS